MRNPPAPLLLRAQRLRRLKWRSISEVKRWSDGLGNCSFLSALHEPPLSSSCALGREIRPRIGLVLVDSDGKRFWRVGINDSPGSIEGAVTCNNAINTDGKLARAFGANEFAAGYGWR